jgi:hypothetical protein
MSSNNGVRTIGWDSIESSVDEMELIQREIDTAFDEELPILKTPKPADSGNDDFARLADLGRIISRARRDRDQLHRIMGTYGLDRNDYDRAVASIGHQTLKTVRNVSKAL